MNLAVTVCPRVAAVRFHLVCEGEWPLDTQPLHRGALCRLVGLGCSEGEGTMRARSRERPALR